MRAADRTLKHLPRSARALVFGLLLSMLLAVALPIVAPSSFALLCKGAGNGMVLLALGTDGQPQDGAGADGSHEECPVCAQATGAPPPSERHVAALGHPADEPAGLSASPAPNRFGVSPPARGPPRI